MTAVAVKSLLCDAMRNLVCGVIGIIAAAPARPVIARIRESVCAIAKPLVARCSTLSASGLLLGRGGLYYTGSRFLFRFFRTHQAATLGDECLGLSEQFFGFFGREDRARGVICVLAVALQTRHQTSHLRRQAA